MANIKIDKAIIKNVSSPEVLQNVALDRGLNPQEVFVRVTFEHEGKEYGVSNKLRFLTKTGYRELLSAKETGEPMSITVDVEKGFFYINHNVSIDDLFAQDVEKEDKRAQLTELLAAISG